MDPRADILRQAATAAGYDPVKLAAVMSYESGLDPTRWGGKGGNYYGLIQFGPNERKKYGVVPGQTDFSGQVNAAIRFLQDRGYKPNMGLLDMYSTVLAGRPGLYNRADQNGSVQSHVARMQEGALRKAEAFLGGKLSPPTQIPPNMVALAPTQVGGGFAPVQVPTTQDKAPLDSALLAQRPSQPSGFLGQALASATMQDQADQEEQAAWEENFRRKLLEQHARQAGLLG